MSTREERRKARDYLKRLERDRLVAVRSDAPLGVFQAIPLYTGNHTFLQHRTTDDRGTGYAQTHVQYASIRRHSPFINGNHPTTKVPHTHLSVEARQLSVQGVINVLCHEGQHEALQRLYIEAAEAGSGKESEEMMRASVLLDHKRLIFLAVEGCLQHLPGLTFGMFCDMNNAEWTTLTNTYHFMGSCTQP